ncbi:hypothetical protein GCM10022267_83520 [Lentzea roselyniae]|uniref:[acyl-carrier-protein] S-malonyltransferase n=1 Tax=Lentzea roselyniae TaxID=531940 RepID=A0ABP7CCT5_9PSEU
MQRVAFLFPGQGSYVKGALSALAELSPDTAAVFTTINEVGRSLGEPTVTAEILGDRPLEKLVVEEPTGLQLAMFGISVALFTELRGRGVEPHVLVGHSVGEIAALTCAGAFDLADGARVVHLRNRVLSKYGAAGVMAAVGADAERVEALVRAVDDPRLVVACHNAPRQTVVSGPAAAVGQVVALATALGLWSRQLNAPQAYHSPVLIDAMEPLREALTDLRQRPLRHPVLSPVLGRPCRDDDDLVGLIVDHLRRPVLFMETVRFLHARNVTDFVECGARDILTELVLDTVPNVRVLPCLTRRTGLRDELDRVAGVLTGESADAGDHPAPARTEVVVPAEEPQPGPAPREAWSSHPPDRPGVLAELRAIYAAALEYPLELVEADADLEADLGVDSLKQTTLLANTWQHFGLSPLPTDFRISDFPTLDHIADLVLSLRGGA